MRDLEGEKARRRAAREVIGSYHEQQLRLLLEHVRDGFARLDAGELDAFGLDELIHHYKRSAQKLWSFCGSSGGGWERAALTLEWWREQGEEDAKYDRILDMMEAHVGRPAARSDALEQLVRPHRRVPGGGLLGAL
jgi:hypothetical protein